MSKIEMYLKMKNASAEGTYNDIDSSVIVKAGAVLENPVSEGFKTHNYMKLRMEIVNSDNVVDYILQHDYSFNSLSAAAAVIGGRSAAGPLEWHVKDGRTIKDYLESQDRIRRFIDFFEEHNDLKANDEYMKEAQYFVEKFPLDKIRKMKLEDYDEPGRKDTFTYLLEQKTKKLSGGMFGSSRNKLFFLTDGEYKNIKFISEKHPGKTVQERFEMYREDLYQFITEFDEKSYVCKEYNVFPKGTNYIRSKLLNLFYPNTLIYIDSITIYRKILKYLSIESKNLQDSIEMNITLKRFINNIIPKSREIQSKDLSDIIWKFYTEEISGEGSEIIEDDIKDEALMELFIDNDKIDEIEYLLKKKKNIILQGTPGVGKTFSVKKIIKDRFEITNSDEQILTVQFHQSFSYEEFIEGLRPRSYDSGFSVEAGIFKKFVDDSVKLNPDKPYFLIIDEINRGNLSKIFGELLMLIEVDKRETETVMLPYSNQSFYVPSNLYIIGTMNTADRSLALMDYALRRRFSFVNLIPMFNSSKFNKHLESSGLNNKEIAKVNSTMDYINNEINKDLGKNFEIGHSYFVEDNVEDFNVWYNSIIKYDIVPLLEEYYFDDEEKVKKFLTDLGLVK